MTTQSSLNDVIKEAIRVLRANDWGRFTVPAAGLYPHQWLWDSAWIALGWQLLDEQRAWRELASVFDAQWPDGMLPHITFREDNSHYFPGPAVWKAGTHPPSSGITQPPVMAIVLRQLYEQSRDSALAWRMLKELLPRIMAFHRWLYRARDPEGTGLVNIIHPWESGMDNSPAWDEALARVPLPDDASARTELAALHKARRDVRHVDSSQRPTDAEYRRYISLVVYFREAGYDSARLGQEAPFRVADVGFNALLHRANRDLKALLEASGEDSREVTEWIARAEVAFAQLWNDQLGLYVSLDRVTGQPIEVPTVGGLLPLYAGLPDEARARKLVATIEDWGQRCRYLVPSTAPNHPTFDPKRYWRGPVWVVTNWLLWQALRAYGHQPLARRLAEDTFALVQTEGFREYYHPETGSGLGGRDFSWSAALMLAWAVAAGRWQPGSES